MKIQYDEEQIQTIGIILGRIEVRGVEQARLLVTLENVIKKGIAVEEKKKEDTGNGNINGSELLQQEKAADKSGDNGREREKHSE